MLCCVFIGYNISAVYCNIFNSWNASSPLIDSDAKNYDVCYDKFMTHFSTGKKIYICLRKNGLISNHIRRYGEFTQCNALFKLWENGDKESKNDIFVDVGANIGSCSLLMAASGINVVAFEPVPSNLFST